MTACKYRVEAKIRRERQKRRSIAAVGMATMLGGRMGSKPSSAAATPMGVRPPIQTGIGGLAAGFTLGKPQSCETTSLTAENLASAAAAPMGVPIQMAPASAEDAVQSV